MADYKNFYETIEEANFRLQGTVVLYDGMPHYIWTICKHADGVFRVYMSTLPDAGKGATIPALSQVSHGHASMGQLMDQYVDGGYPLAIKILRKKMDSPKFAKFRPFPLGMMNKGGGSLYVARQPLKPNTKQGLIPQMIHATPVTTSFTAPGKVTISMNSTEFHDCIMGDYPSPKECLEGLTSGKNTNEAAAFHREFALVKGPIDTMFLAYRDEVVGALPHSDFSAVNLGREFKHLKEVTNELRLFTRVN